MPIRTKRWNDPPAPEDGFRLLICRIRPRGVPKAKETWDEWWADLGPSRALLDAFHGKGARAPAPARAEADAEAAPLPWEEYVPRYLDEMRGPGQIWRIRDLGRRVAAGETITLLCSAACVDATRCHRTLLAHLISEAAGAEGGRGGEVRRRPGP